LNRDGLAILEERMMDDYHIDANGWKVTGWKQPPTLTHVTGIHPVTGWKWRGIADVDGNFTPWYSIMPADKSGADLTGGETMMNRCFWGKMLNWLWTGISEGVAVVLVMSLLVAAIAGIAHALTCPLPDASPIVDGLAFLLRMLALFLILVILIKMTVFEVGAKLRQFVEECR